MTARSRNCLVVCGATASGKTALGVRLALHLDGEIISADSRQVYRGMDIGTGKDLEEYVTPEGSVPFHLVDVAEPTEVYSLFHYQRAAYRVFREISSRGRLPVIVGGTGLYIEAVLRRFEVPDVPSDQPFRDAQMSRPLEDLVDELRGRAPEAAKHTVLDCKRRVVRALEIARYAELHGTPPVNTTPTVFRPLVLRVVFPREELRRRIRERLEHRIQEGMIDEVRRLIDAGIPRWRYELFGMEYKHVARYVRGEVPLERMKDELFADIWYLARRQETYFRGMRKRGIEMEDVPRADLKTARRIVDAHALAPEALTSAPTPGDEDAPG